MSITETRLEELRKTLSGDLKHDKTTRTIYSTDASVYKEEPLAVAWPRNPGDIKKIIEFAAQCRTSIIPRAGGTSLAGQVVGSGIVVDVSRYMNRILEINTAEKWVRVEPGVVLDELNIRLKEHGLFFGPETSTSNRCNIGGMIGNNACGSHSIIYGSTRDHLLEVKAILSDGSDAVFSSIDADGFREKCSLESLEGKIYRNINSILGTEENRTSIRQGYPERSIERRNTGYALDLLLDCELFDGNSEAKFNMCRLLAGSEGTLAFVTEAKLNLVPLPPANKALVCVHLEKRNDAFRANLIALKYKPSAVEMMDDRILSLTEDNLSQRNNRFFLEGNPAAILIVEFMNPDMNSIDEAAKAMSEEMRKAGYGYAYPVVKGKEISRVWELRKAGLGILANMKGDAKPVALIEDTAVGVEDLPEYMVDIERMLDGHGKDAVFHAHIGTGELHLRPVLDLKKVSDTELFRTIGLETARIVKKYRGSLSGEHGDGRLRGEFIPLMLGERNYDLLREVKQCWDPFGIMNPGKITDTPSMNSSLRYVPGSEIREPDTVYDFSSTGGIIRAAEKCNGSADCRKSSIIGGVMCPSFMATGDEEHSTRARANLMREFLSGEGDPWDHREVYDILDLCLGCKGCKAECPSGVDIAKLRSEYLQHWYDRHGIPLRTRMIAYISTFNKLGSLAPALYNFFLGNRFFASLIKRLAGFAEKRSIPLLYRYTFRKWLRKNLDVINPANPVRTVCLFIDEFTDYNDTETGMAAVRLLTGLGYRIIIPGNSLSGRTFISKGLLRKAKNIARKNIILLSGIASSDTPLLGIEPSAILGFRDEYPDLAGTDLREQAEKLAGCSFMIDEFISSEFKAGRITSDQFTKEDRTVLVHGHCQQKAVASSKSTVEMLSIPAGYRVREIPSGCCGMAGSFGYEKEHFDLSNRIGEMVLFPEVRNSSQDTLIAAPGTSCRHHIKDGTGRQAMHPVEIMLGALA